MQVKSQDPSTGFSVLLPQKCKLPTTMACKAPCDGAPLPALQPRLIHLPSHILCSGHRHLLTIARLFRALSCLGDFAHDVLHNLECFFLHSFQSGIFHSSHLSLNISSEEYSLISPLIIRYYNSLPVFFIILNTVFLG